MNAFGISSVGFERSRVVKILIRGSQVTRSLPGAVGGRVRLAYAPGQVKPADREAEAKVPEGVLGVLQRAGRDRCARCAEPIEPGLLALAAIMCASCRAKP